MPAIANGDPGRLRQILLNLAGNALKFTEEGGVTVRVSATPGSARQAMLRVEITDTGIGISPEAQSRLFVPFSQADTSTTRRYGGTGLGLAVCKRLAEALGGRIGVAQRAGAREHVLVHRRSRGRRGSTSRARGAAFASRSGGGRSGGGASGARASSFAPGEWSSTKRLVAESALEQLRRADASGALPDVVLLDLQMPGMNGLQLSLAMKADRPLVEIPVVMLAPVGQRGLAAAALSPASPSV